MTARLWEKICGSFATLWGLVVEGYLLFGPSYRFAGGTANGVTTGQTGAIGAGLAPATVISLSVLTVVLLLIGVAAWLDNPNRQSAVLRVLLLVATVVLLLFSCAAIASIGLLLIPSLGAALAAAVLAWQQPRRAVSP